MRALRSVGLLLGACALVLAGISVAGATNPTPGVARGNVIDAFTGSSLSGICVTATNTSDPTIHQSGVSGTTALSPIGYSIDNLPPGTYSIAAGSCVGTPPIYTSPNPVTVQVASNQTVTAPALGLARQASPFPYGIVSGSVLDATTHAPISGVCVRGPLDGRRTQQDVGAQTAVTGADGTYRFDNAVPLAYVEVSAGDCVGTAPTYRANSVHLVVQPGPVPTAALALLLTRIDPPPPLLPPGTPRTPVATRARASATAAVTWSAQPNGGAPATYRIAAYPAGQKKPAFTTTVPAPTTSVQLTVGHGRRYSFTVTAINAAGTSAASAQSNRV